MIDCIFVCVLCKHEPCECDVTSYEDERMKVRLGARKLTIQKAVAYLRSSKKDNGTLPSPYNRAQRSEHKSNA